MPYKSHDEYLIYQKEYHRLNKVGLAKQRHDHYIIHRKRLRKIQKKYGKSERGRKSNNQSVQKYRAIQHGKLMRHKEHCRRKGYDSIRICNNIFPDCINIAWHHVNDDYIIALPDKIHQETTGTNNNKRHRKLALEWIELLYPKNIYDVCLERVSNL